MSEKQIVYEPLADLVAAQDPENAKDHDIGAIVASIERFGFRGAVLRDPDSGTLVAGHGRVQALDMLHYSDKDLPPAGIRLDAGQWLVPVAYERFENEVERDAYAIADNKLVELGGWETKLLIAKLESIAGDDPGLVGTGFDEDDLDFLKAVAADPDGDDSTAIPDTIDDPHFGVDIAVGTLREEQQIVDFLRHQMHYTMMRRHSGRPVADG